MHQLRDGRWWDPAGQRRFTFDGTRYRGSDDQLYLYENDGLYRQLQASLPARWLTDNFVRSRSVAMNLIASYTATDKTMAWTMFDYWNLVHPGEAIDHGQVGLVPGQRESDISKAEAEKESAPALITVPVFSSKSYKLANRPAPGTVIALPSDQEVAGNVDYYWQGRNDEMGGDAAERKKGKHGFSPVGAYQFARQCTKWFMQADNPNHVIFHNFPQGSGVVHMAVWNWTTGQMVTYYDIDQSRPEGVEGYLRSKGMP